jgi:hypothetical protein
MSFDFHYGFLGYSGFAFRNYSALPVPFFDNKIPDAFLGSTKRFLEPILRLAMPFVLIGA